MDLCKILELQCFYRHSPGLRGVALLTSHTHTHLRIFVLRNRKVKCIAALMSFTRGCVVRVISIAVM